MLNQTKIYLILVALCLLVYANSLTGAFINDDKLTILQNHSIGCISHFWLDPQGLLNSLAYRFSGYNPIGYHLISVSLHSINTVLVFLFLGMFFKTIPSFLGACLFAVHPVHTEAVAWISGRGCPLLTFFMLISYFLYYRALNPRNKDRKYRLFWYILSVVIFLYLARAMFSLSYFFPLFLILTDLTFDKWKKHWKWWLPFLAIVIIRFILAHDVISNRIAYVAEETGYLPAKNPFVYPAISFYGHLWLLLWPQKLALHHNVVFTKALYNYSAFYLLPVMVLLCILFKKAKELFFALSLFILFFIPTYSPVPLTSPVAERYLYFPSISLSMVVAFIYGRYAVTHDKRRRFFLSLFICLLLAYSIRTVIRNQDWKTPAIFWSNTLKVFPNNMQAYNDLGLLRLAEGDSARAIEYFDQAIQIYPRYAAAYNNRGLVYQAQGNIAQALLDYTKAIQSNPHLAEAYYNRGNAYKTQGNFTQVLLDYTQALRINPAYAKAYLNRGNVYQIQGNFTQALFDYNQALRINHDYAEAYLNRGNVYEALGNLTQALLDYNKAIQLNPQYALAYNNRGIAYINKGDYARAILDASRAISLIPTNAMFYNMRAGAYYYKKEYGLAWADVHKAEELGYKVDPWFLGSLKKESGREN